MRESVWILGDQLSPDHPGLAAGRPVVLIESLGRLRQRPYHRRKLGLLLAAMRHYAEELRARGFTVDYRESASFLDGLREHIAAHGIERIVCVAAAEYDTRQAQLALADSLGIAVTVLPSSFFLCEQHPPARPPKLMEPFYREMRRRTGLLIDAAGQPVGGEWNFDTQNRRRYDGRPVPPPPRFPPDRITRRALADLDARCPEAIGDTDGFDLPVTRADALAALDDFVAHRLADFGPFEDAMSSAHAGLFHSQLSPLINIGLLAPHEVCLAAVAAYEAGHAPLASVEGFVRQIIGWREYIYLRYWELMPGLRDSNSWGHQRPLPAWYWSGDTGMRCMSHAIGRVLQGGYSHHIERLMLLCNFALLAGIAPQEVNAWFLSCYIDAYDWVVTPNVIGMGLNADGGAVATKPYIASASYINKMSDYCGGCVYDRTARSGPHACPFNSLYWNFLIVHEGRLRASPRLGPAVLGLRKLDGAERAAVQARAGELLGDLDQL